MVKQVDREVEVNILTMALNLCGLMVSYEQTELLLEVQKVIEKKGSAFNIENGVKLKMKWERKWEDYHKGIE